MGNHQTILSKQISMVYATINALTPAQKKKLPGPRVAALGQIQAGAVAYFRPTKK